MIVKKINRSNRQHPRHLFVASVTQTPTQRLVRSTALLAGSRANYAHAFVQGSVVRQCGRPPIYLHVTSTTKSVTLRNLCTDDRDRKPQCYQMRNSTIRPTIVSIVVKFDRSAAANTTTPPAAYSRHKYPRRLFGGPTVRHVDTSSLISVSAQVSHTYLENPLRRSNRLGIQAAFRVRLSSETGRESISSIR